MVRAGQKRQNDEGNKFDGYATGALATPCGWAYLTAGEAGVAACIWPLTEEELAVWKGGGHCCLVGGMVQDGMITWRSGSSVDEIIDETVVEKRAHHELKQAAEALLAYFSGKFTSFDNVEIDSRKLSLWQRMVYYAVRSIPYGEVRSYKWVAEECGKPGGARAVGQALAVNPTPLFVPCHRVIHSDGCTGDFMSRRNISGSVLKKLLLQWEKGEVDAPAEISRPFREGR